VKYEGRTRQARVPCFTSCVSLVVKKPWKGGYTSLPSRRVLPPALFSCCALFSGGCVRLKYGGHATMLPVKHRAADASSYIQNATRGIRARRLRAACAADGRRATPARAGCCRRAPARHSRGGLPLPLHCLLPTPHVGSDGHSRAPSIYEAFSRRGICRN